MPAPSVFEQMNYFVAHATTRIFVTSTGAAPGHLATIIGAPNLSAIFAAMFHCWILSKEPARSVRLLQCLFLVASCFGVVGSIVGGAAVVLDSVPLAVLGRFLFGFSSTEILGRQVIGLCLPSHVVGESARLVQVRVAGMILGLLFGSFAEAVPIAINDVDIRVIQLTSWVMMILWLVHSVRVCCQFRPQINERTWADDIGIAADNKQTVDCKTAGDNVQDDSDSSKSDVGTTASDLNGSSSSLAADNPLKASYAKELDGLLPLAAPSTDEGELRKPQQAAPTFLVKKKRAGVCRQIKKFATRLRKLLGYHVCIPLSFVILLYTSFGLEVFLTATPIIAGRYFGWSGVHSAVLLAILAACILPVNFICERISRKYEERTVLKRSLRIIPVGLFIMVNWLSLFTLASHVPKLLADRGTEIRPTGYDWKLGVFQFVIGIAVTFIGLTAVDGSNLPLLSKLSPQRHRGLVLNVGTLATFLSLTARLAADLYILMVDLSHKLISTDIVNALVIPLFLLCFVLSYLVKKHFFFLM